MLFSFQNEIKKARFNFSTTYFRAEDEGCQTALKAAQSRLEAISLGQENAKANCFNF